MDNFFSVMCLTKYIICFYTLYVPLKLWPADYSVCVALAKGTWERNPQLVTLLPSPWAHVFLWSSSHRSSSKEQINSDNLTSSISLYFPPMGLFIRVTDCKRCISIKENPAFTKLVLFPRVSLDRPDLLLVKFKLTQNPQVKIFRVEAGE